MKLRELFFILAVVGFGTMNSKAIPPLGIYAEDVFASAAAAPPFTEMAVALPAPPAAIAADDVLSSAYYDTLGILKDQNECSKYFGGPETAIDVFTRLVGTITKERHDPEIGMSMSGPITAVLNARTKVQYRLFNKAVLNVDGPFYKGDDFNGQQKRIGSFEPNSREIRVLMLLHELGHLMKGKDGKWLLPDDGKNQTQSRRNSKTVEVVCGEQIRNLQ